MILFTDFDGTITQQDVLDEVLTRFASSEWLEIEKQWVSGAIGSLDCLRAQMALVQARTSDIETLLDSIEIDPTFESFLTFCFTREIPLRIVSDNFQWFIRHILNKNFPDYAAILKTVPIFANEVKMMGTRLEFGFPYSGGACTHGCATCKAEIIRKARETENDEVIFIGDGMSDRFGARQADLVFAKSHLLEYCHREGIEVIPFEQFSKIQRWVETKKQAPTKQKI
ncbi:MAG: MtnX-like HAD-IB family phosphatase [Candidatus Omnitrophica bacterium]|nr:MtnX-like HAD-IB family phosphatase [Candidatus Omnitrophota bacterium]